MNSQNNEEFISKYLWVYLVCQICKKILTEPRTLSCQHSFCSSCIEKEFDESIINFKKFTFKIYKLLRIYKAC